MSMILTPRERPRAARRGLCPHAPVGVPNGYTCACQPGCPRRRAERGGRGRRSERLRLVVACGVAALWPVRPLLEPGTAAVISEADDPQIAVFLARRISIADLGPDHGRRAVDGEDVCGQGEDLAGAISFFLPHPLDRIQAGDALVVRGLQVGGV